MAAHSTSARNGRSTPRALPPPWGERGAAGVPAAKSPRARARRKSICSWPGNFLILTFNYDLATLLTPTASTMRARAIRAPASRATLLLVYVYYRANELTLSLLNACSACFWECATLFFAGAVRGKFSKHEPRQIKNMSKRVGMPTDAKQRLNFFFKRWKQSKKDFSVLQSVTL